MKKPKQSPKTSDLTVLISHGLPITSVENDVVTWAKPPTSAEVAFANELLARKVSHSHV